MRFSVVLGCLAEKCYGYFVGWDPTRVKVLEVGWVEDRHGLEIVAAWVNLLGLFF